MKRLLRYAALDVYIHDENQRWGADDRKEVGDDGDEP